MSRTLRSMRRRSPLRASFSSRSIVETPSMCLASPSSVPPPTPVPLKCAILPGVTDTIAVPVPSETTSALSLPASEVPPIPIAVNSLTLTTGLPSRESASTREPAPVAATHSMSSSLMPKSATSFPSAPAAAATASLASIVTTCRPPFSRMTASVVEPPISMPTIIGGAGSCPARHEARSANATCATTRREGSHAPQHPHLPAAMRPAASPVK